MPPGPIQELRDLTRTRKHLMREIGQHKQRLQKVLEDANVKLASVVSDVFGESGRRMLKALSAGETDPWHITADPVHHRDQVKKPLRHRNISDVGRPHLMDAFDAQSAQKVGVDAMAWSWAAGARPLIDHFNPCAASSGTRCD